MLQHSDFEFGTGLNISNKDAFVKYLIDVWSKHRTEYIEDEEVPDRRDRQPFFSFDGNMATPKNYIGFIQTEYCNIEIYPKVFKRQYTTNVNKSLFLKHIFFWFDYCRKWKFPFTNVNLDLFNEIEFPELIINLMASQILDVISITPISLYQEVEESLTMPRGRINFNRYISHGLINGNQHILECDYEPLMFDNSLNRVIKYVARILQNKTKFDDTKLKLNEIIFILDEVEDIACTIKDLDSIKLNSFFTDYQYVIDICRMVLAQQIYSNEHYEQSQWCLLFPMEYVFEDFVAGFLETHFSKDWDIKYQKSEKYFVDEPEKAFQMRHDIYLEAKPPSTRKIIIDTKYKIRYPESRNDAKKGIAQSDMYQMTSYALRRGCNEVLLLYPNHGEAPQPNDFFVVESGFDTKHKINITAAEIPFWSMDSFKQLSESLKLSLEQLLAKPSPKDNKLDY